MRGLNGRGWRGGPGPRLSAEHPLGWLCLGLGYLRELREWWEASWWEGAETLTEVLCTPASRASWETRGASPLSSPNLTHILARSPPE